VSCQLDSILVKVIGESQNGLSGSIIPGTITDRLSGWPLGQMPYFVNEINSDIDNIKAEI